MNSAWAFAMAGMIAGLLGIAIQIGRIAKVLEWLKEQDVEKMEKLNARQEQVLPNQPENYRQPGSNPFPRSKRRR